MKRMQSGVQTRSLTRFSNFPDAMAIADSKQPVVENVQQLPQGPLGRRKRTRQKPKQQRIYLSDSGSWEGSNMFIFQFQDFSSPMIILVVMLPTLEVWISHKFPKKLFLAPLLLGTNKPRSASYLIFHRCHIFSFLPPVYGFWIWANTANKVANGGRTVLKATRALHSGTTQSNMWFPHLSWHTHTRNRSPSFATSIVKVCGWNMRNPDFGFRGPEAALSHGVNLSGFPGHSWITSVPYLQ